MVGTDENTFRLVKPLLEIMGRDIIYLGEFGKGMAGKVLNNFVAACSVVAVRHVLAESNGFGLNPDELVKVLNASSGKTWFSEGLFDIEWAQDGRDDPRIDHETDDLVDFLRGLSKGA